MKKYIPNGLTCLNLFSGCVGIVLAFNGHLIDAGYAIVVSILFDFFDGYAARLLQVTSPIGKELDSLADMVSFGFLPSVIIFQMLQNNPDIAYGGAYVKYMAFILTIFSALRLAKFNTDIRQGSIFIGLPTPACAMVVLALPHIAMSQNILLGTYITNPVILIILTLVLSFLLVAEMPLFSLKFKDYGMKNNIYRYTLLAFSVIFLLFLKFSAIPLIVSVYIVLSAIQFNRLR